MSRESQEDHKKEMSYSLLFETDKEMRDRLLTFIVHADSRDKFLKVRFVEKKR